MCTSDGHMTSIYVPKLPKTAVLDVSSGTRRVTIESAYRSSLFARAFSGAVFGERKESRRRPAHLTTEIHLC